MTGHDLANRFPVFLQGDRWFHLDGPRSFGWKIVPPRLQRPNRAIGGCGILGKDDRCASPINHSVHAHDDSALHRRHERTVSITAARPRLKLSFKFPKHCVSAEKFTVRSKSEPVPCHIACLACLDWTLAASLATTRHDDRLRGSVFWQYRRAGNHRRIHERQWGALRGIETRASTCPTHSGISMRCIRIRR